MITNFNKYNESIRDQMVPKEDDEILANSDSKGFFYKLHHQILVAIEDKDLELIKRLLKYLEKENINKHFLVRDFNTYIEAAEMSNFPELIPLLNKHKDLMVESLRDQMTPKSDIEVYTKALKLLDKLKIKGNIYPATDAYDYLKPDIETMKDKLDIDIYNLYYTYEQETHYNDLLSVIKSLNKNYGQFDAETKLYVYNLYYDVKVAIGEPMDFYSNETGYDNIMFIDLRHLTELLENKISIDEKV